MRLSLIASVAMLGLVCACSGGSVQQTLGIDRKAPDEFRVVSRPPLSVPPQFSLRAPGTTEGSSTPAPTDKQAETLVLGSGKQPSGSETFSLKNSATATIPASQSSVGGTAESQLLKNAGADVSDPSVRNTLMEERLMIQEQKEDRPWWDVTLWNTEKKDPMVSAKEEAERIKKNKEEGKPVTEGETPQTKSRDRGILGYIFGD